MHGFSEPWLSQLYPQHTRGPVLLETLPWPTLRQMLDGGHELLLLPVGATEQHGPHLPVNTDTLIATASCCAASALTGVPVLPALNYPVSLGHTEKWPGTFAVFHETLMATVREIAQWAAASGWKRLLIVNSHFGNDAALRCAVDRLRFDFGGKFFVAMRNTWALTPEIAAEFSSDAGDWHANDAETSVIQFVAPELVSSDFASADDPDRTAGCVFAHMVAHTSANGVTGAPSKASPRRGAALLRQIVDALVAVIARARHEEAPLAWDRTTSAFAA
jgi:creatinine amidohydrolase